MVLDRQNYGSLSCLCLRLDGMIMLFEVIVFHFIIVQLCLFLLGLPHLNSPLRSCGAILVFATNILEE
jgi:hypothetical protein